MFTPDGELREEFRHLEESPGREEPSGEERGTDEQDATGSDVARSAAAEAKPTAGSPSIESPPSGRVEQEPPTGPIAGAEATAGPGEGPDGEAEVGKMFPELIGVLAEPAALYLGDAQLPDGRTMENAEMARLHIDLLAALKAKTAGNLDERESALLDNILYQLRVRYVQKFGPQ